MSAPSTGRGLLLALVLATLGCGRHSLKLSWVDEGTLKYDPSRYPDDPAVVLHRSDHRLMMVTEASYSQVGRHEVFALQTEGGFDLAEVKVAFRATDKLLELRARMRQPGGAWEELDPKSMLSDTSGTGERDVNAKFFRFPRIQVGTLLEYYWVIESEGLWWADDQDSVGQYPVRRYQFELEASKEVATTITTYNTALPIRSETLANKNTRLALEIHDIPHRPVEDYAPDWTFTEPRWAWRVIAFDWGLESTRAWHTWDELLKFQGGDLFGVHGKLFEGFEPPRLPACPDVGCRISQARAWVRENARNKALAADLSCRPMKEVLESKRANGQERAVLLRRLLADAGLQTRLAFATRHWSAQLDPSFPTLARFNEMLIYLPPQAGLPAGAWLAPRCDDCAVNALPTDLRGLEVLVFNATSLGFSGVTLKSEWKSTADAEPSRPNAVRIVHQAQLDATGELNDEVRQSFEGQRAGDELLLHESQTEADLGREEHSQLSHTSALAALFEVTPRTCQPEAGVCTRGRRFSIPAYATAESDARWLVPLNALSPAYSTQLTKDKERRVAELHLQTEEEFEEVFELVVLPGFVLETPPPPAAVSTALVQTSVKVEPTPKGARVTRTLKRSIGGVPLAQYGEVQEAFRAFQDARHLVLSFVKR